MAKALRLAQKGLYSTHPNPRVGCIIVRDGELIASGFHEYPGGPHAEINALEELAKTENKKSADKCTVYVTLEPCSHTGKTPPCVDALIEAGPRTVVIAMQDPNPLVAGRGIKKLQLAGIEVICDVLEQQAMELNAGFIKRMLDKRPLVRLKMASSLDGRSALANGLSQWITGDQARQDVQFMRARSSAILSTAKTIVADEASLNVRLSQQQLNQMCPVRQPIRIIIDSKLVLTGEEKLFSLAGDVWVFTRSDDAQAISRLRQRNVQVFQLANDDFGQIDLSELMCKLAELEINEVHTECGAVLAGALVKQNLVDELVLYIAPSLLGNQAKGLFDLGEISIMSDRIQLAIHDVRCIGKDIRITARPEIPCPQ
jgi:diaminohydroxyphosphoribosylaminopyrimidine deaminase/5-amino-6-(5-phosphoribosylamino)uracil reductase